MTKVIPPQMGSSCHGEGLPSLGSIRCTEGRQTLGTPGHHSGPVPQARSWGWWAAPALSLGTMGLQPWDAHHLSASWETGDCITVAAGWVSKLEKHAQHQLHPFYTHNQNGVAGWPKSQAGQKVTPQAVRHRRRGESGCCGSGSVISSSGDAGARRVQCYD